MLQVKFCVNIWVTVCSLLDVSQKVVYTLILVNTAFIYISKGFSSVMWWVSVQLALLNSLGNYSALHRPFLAFRIVWLASFVTLNIFIWLWPVPQKDGERLFSDVCSLPLHTPKLMETNHCFWVCLKGRVGAGDISFSASADGLMFNRKPRGHKCWEMRFQDWNPGPQG